MLKYQLNYQIKRFTDLDKKLKRIKDIDLEGSLVISKNKGFIQYYHCYYQNKKRFRKYINKDQKYLAKKLAKKSYLSKLKRTVRSMLKHLNALNEVYEDDIVEKVYTELPEEKQILFSPIEPTREQVVNAWLAKPYFSNTFPKSDFIITTLNGEQVRSKSEKILADYFYSKGLKYKYECQLILNRTTIYPDFTFLHPITKKEIYWEHFGMMDLEEYSKSAYDRINLYEKNGILLGDRLIVSFESESQNFDYSLLDAKINMYLI